MSIILQFTNAETGKLQVFPAWTNNLEKEPVKPTEIKKVIEKIEYKTKQKINKQIEVRSYVIKRKVTKDYLDR